MAAPKPTKPVTSSAKTRKKGHKAAAKGVQAAPEGQTKAPNRAQAERVAEQDRLALLEARIAKLEKHDLVARTEELGGKAWVYVKEAYEASPARTAMVAGLVLLVLVLIF